jgi:hypothetical protein
VTTVLAGHLKKLQRDQASSPQRHRTGVAPTSERDDRLTEIFPREEISERLAHLINSL